MKLEQLRVLDAVVKAGSFSRAGNEILMLSQPAVSAAIRQLEQDLGFEVFDRSQYRAQLSPAGERFYREARQLLVQAEALQNLGTQLAQGVEPDLRLAVDQGCLYLRNLETFRQQFDQHPQTRFHFEAGILGSSVDRLLDGEVDLAICPWFAAYDNLSQLESHTLARLKISTMVSPCYPPLRHFVPGEPVGEKDLQGCVQIITRSSERHLPPGGFGIFPQCRPWYVNDHTSKKLLIQAGLGFGMLHHTDVSAELACGDLRTFQELRTYTVRHSDIRLVRLRQRAQGPVLKSIWQALCQQAVFDDAEDGN